MKLLSTKIGPNITERQYYKVEKGRTLVFAIVVRENINSQLHTYSLVPEKKHKKLKYFDRAKRKQSQRQVFKFRQNHMHIRPHIIHIAKAN